jgi:hypothetical protein
MRNIFSITQNKETVCNMSDKDEKSPRGSSRQRSYDSRSRERAKDRKRVGSRDRKRDSRDRHRDSSRSRHKSRDSRDRRDTDREREKKSDRSEVRSSKRSRSRSRSKNERDRSESKNKSRIDKKVSDLEEFSSKRKSESFKGSSSDPKRERWKPVEKEESIPVVSETSFVAETAPVFVRPPPPPLPPPRYLSVPPVEQSDQEIENESKKTADEQLQQYEQLVSKWKDEKNGLTLNRINKDKDTSMIELPSFEILEKYCGKDLFAEVSKFTRTSATKHQRKPESFIRDLIRREQSHPMVEKSRSGEVKESSFMKEANLSRMEITPVKDKELTDLDASLMTDGDDDLDLYGDLGNSLLVGDDDNTHEEKDSHHDSLYGDLMGETETATSENVSSAIQGNNPEIDVLAQASEEEALYKSQRNQAFESFMSSTLFPWSELPYLAQVFFHSLSFRLILSFFGCRIHQYEE